MQSDPALFTLQVRLIDKFGDNGMISVIICRPMNGNWQIDTWLMSCRVLKRNVELAVLNEIMAAAQANGIPKILGIYMPTEKNELVRDHYRDLGFSCIRTNDDGSSEWVLDVGSYRPHDLPMTIERSASYGISV
jgi:FkbH-like protein